MKQFFKADFLKHELYESILDFPKDGLCPSVWMDNGFGEFVLTPKAKSAIFAVVEWTRQRFQFESLGANLAGSITSNSYGSNSDIDIHFNSKDIDADDADEFTKKLRKAFDEEFKRDFPQMAEIDGHPMEVYFQKNVFQDLMSVGCYDILRQQWLVGPEFHDQDFDPYSQYYSADMHHVDDIIDDIRSVMMEAYEKSLVLVKAKDTKFKSTIEKQFLKATIKAAKLFTKLRKHRILLSTPKNVEDAMKKRDSKEWKIADSSFKLLDKFGYTAILKAITTCFENKDDKDFNVVEAALSVIKAVNDNLSMQNIDDSEEDLDESIVGSVGRHLALATLLAMPGILPAKQISMSLDQIKAHGQLTQQSQEFQDMMTDIAKDEKMFGTREDHTLPASKLANALAWSIMAEAADQYAKYGSISLEAIASTMLNRAGGDPNNYIDVISAPAQYSEWNGYKGGWTNETYEMRYPKHLANTKVRTIWNRATIIACDMVLGNFKSVIGNRNMIGNEKRDNKKAYSSWGSKCDLQIGDHKFGYQPDQDGWKKAKKACPYDDSTIPHDSNITLLKLNKYTIQPGDVASSIAKHFNTTVQAIRSANPTLKDIGKISIGQQIIVPVVQNMGKTAAQDTDSSKTMEVASTNVPDQAQQPKIVVVKAGDSLSAIARSNSTTVSSILKKNKGLKLNSILQIGQKIYV